MTVVTEFARTARVGPIALGASRGAVEVALGRPDAVSAHDVLWRYGDLQVGFDRDLVTLLVIQIAGPAIELPASLLPEMPREISTDHSAVLADLAVSGVSVRLDPRLSFEGSQSAYRSTAGVWLVFDENDRLVKVGVSPSDIPAR